MSETWENKLLQLMRVSNDTYRRVFVIGSFEHRVTIYSQQVRAVNLVEALLRTHELRAGDSVAMVGAGAAGLTFAAAAATRGIFVTVLERESELLPIFKKQSKRWLHPHVYDWPMDGWNQSRAGLPVLDWEAGVVPEARRQMITSWSEALAKTGNRIKPPIHFAHDVAIMPVEGGVRVTWNVVSNEAVIPGRDKFSLVVLAVGFGREQVDIPQYRGYWDPDDLDIYEGIDPKHPRKWLISGRGDGALMDLLRLCIKDFRQDRMIEEFLSDPSLGVEPLQILEIERDPVIQNDANPEALHNAYFNLKPAAGLVKVLKSRRRIENQVTLNATDANFFCSKSSALNRFLVSQLMHAGAFRFVPGKVIKTKKEGERFRVTIENKELEPFHRVVFRHGPQMPVQLEKDFPDIWKSCTPLREAWKSYPLSLDQTRKRYWKPGVFSPEVEGGNNPHDAGWTSASTEPPPAATKGRDQTIREPSEQANRIDRTVGDVERLIAEGNRIVRLRGAPGDGKTRIGRRLSARRTNAIYIELSIPTSSNEPEEAEDIWRQGLLDLAQKMNADHKPRERRLNRLVDAVRESLAVMDPTPTIILDNADSTAPFNLQDLLEGNQAICVLIGAGAGGTELLLPRPTSDEFLQMVNEAAAAPVLNAFEQAMVREIGAWLDHSAIASAHIAGLVASGVAEELHAIKRELENHAFAPKDRLNIVFRRAWHKLNNAARGVAMLLGAFAEPEIPVNWIPERFRPSDTIASLIRSGLVERVPAQTDTTMLRAHRLIVQWLRANANSKDIEPVSDVLRTWSVDDELMEHWKSGGTRKGAYNRAFEFISQTAISRMNVQERSFLQLTYIDQSGLYADGPETGRALEKQLGYLAPDQTALEALHPSVLGQLLDALRPTSIEQSTRLQTTRAAVLVQLERKVESIATKALGEISTLDIIAEHHWGKYLAHDNQKEAGLRFLRLAEAHTTAALDGARPSESRHWRIRRAQTRIQIADASADNASKVRILAEEYAIDDLPDYLRITIATRLLARDGGASSDEIMTIARSALKLCERISHEEVRADFLAEATKVARKYRLQALADEVECFTRQRLDEFLCGSRASRRTQMMTAFSNAKAAEGRTTVESLTTQMKALHLLDMAFLPERLFDCSRALAATRDAGSVDAAASIASILREAKTDSWLLLEIAKTMRWTGRLEEADAALDDALAYAKTEKSGVNPRAVGDERAKIAAKRGDMPSVELLLEENARAYDNASEPQFARQNERWLRALRERNELRAEDAILHDEWRAGERRRNASQATLDEIQRLAARLRDRIVGAQKARQSTRVRDSGNAERPVPKLDAHEFAGSSANRPPKHEPPHQTATDMAAPLKIFIVHAAADASYREELTKHLSPLKRSGAIEIASCGSIVAGDDVKTTLDKLLRSAELILLLVSADFFASDECDELMRRALARRDVNSATVVPILVRHYDLKVTPLRDIKPLPRDEKALKDRADRDEVWSAIATEIAGLPRRRVGS